MKQNETKKVPKSTKNLYCEYCQYNTSRFSHFNRHLLTDKHKIKCIETEMKQNETKSTKKYQKLTCNCGLIFNSRTTIWRHKKICDTEKKLEIINDNNEKNKPLDLIQPITQISTELIMELIKDNKNLKNIIIEQNSTINNLVKNGITNMNSNNSYNTNCNNNTFNLQLFLNETCKNAMNITDFVDSIKLQLNDLIHIGEVGYVEGISDIITSNLKALDITQRPVHCTDKKRETIYIKDAGQWEKEDDNKSKLRKSIKKVADKNIKLIPQFKEKYPEYRIAESSVSDKYCKMVIEAMGGMGDNIKEKEDKIIRNISKNITIEKYNQIK
jgi:hypothetical protein